MTPPITEDGGPAFPVIAGQQVYSHGMLLRDWFAGKAMTAKIASEPSALVCSDTYLAKLASEAYRTADAMLAARTTRLQAEEEGS